MAGMNDGDDVNQTGGEPVELPIDGVLDLHTFQSQLAPGPVSPHGGPLSLNDAVEIGERDRPGRSSRRPAD